MATIRKFTFDTRFDDADASRPTLGQALAGSQAAKGAPFELGMASKPRPQPVDAAPVPAPQAEPEPEVEPEAEPEAAAAAAEAEDAGPALAYTEEDMEIAREEAYIAGHTMALDEVATAAEKATADALAEAAAALTGLADGVAEAHAAYADLAARVATAVCRRLLPETAEAYAAEEISGLMRSLLPNLIGQPRLLVRSHPDTRDAVHRSLSAVMEQSGFEGRLSVLADAGLTTSDCRIEWSEGGAERNTTKLWGDIDELLEHNIPLFRRADALELPEDEAPEPEPPAEVWPQDIDPAAWWTPPEAVPEAEAEAAPEADLEPEADDAAWLDTAEEPGPADHAPHDDTPDDDAPDDDAPDDDAPDDDAPGDDAPDDDAFAPDDIAADAPEDAEAFADVRQTQQPVDVDG